MVNQFPPSKLSEHFLHMELWLLPGKGHGQHLSVNATNFVNWKPRLAATSLNITVSKRTTRRAKSDTPNRSGMEQPHLPLLAWNDSNVCPPS